MLRQEEGANQPAFGNLTIPHSDSRTISSVGVVAGESRPDAESVHRAEQVQRNMLVSVAHF